MDPLFCSECKLDYKTLLTNKPVHIIVFFTWIYRILNGIYQIYLSSVKIWHRRETKEIVGGRSWIWSCACAWAERIKGTLTQKNWFFMLDPNLDKISLLLKTRKCYLKSGIGNLSSDCASLEFWPRKRRNWKS